MRIVLFPFDFRGFGVLTVFLTVPHATFLFLNDSNSRGLDYVVLEVACHVVLAAMVWLQGVCDSGFGQSGERGDLLLALA